MAKYNPFRPNSIIAPGMFQGRVEELKDIEQFLVQTKNGNPQHFIIEGERGIGKSSLLLFVDFLASGQIPFENNSRFNFLVVSTELNASSDYFHILQKIAQDLKRAVSQQEKIKTLAGKAWAFLSNWEILGVKYNKPDEHFEPYQALSDLVETLRDITSDANTAIDGVLILIDEADKPDSAANLGELAKLLTEMLTKRNCNKVCIGLAGLPVLMAKLRESHESAPRVFTTLSLKPLEPSERIAVIRSGLKEANEKNTSAIAIDDDAEQLISQLSEGYPHFVQQFSSCAFDADEDGVITVDDVYKGAFSENGAINQLGHKFFREQYYDKISSDNYRVVLQAMAEHYDQWVHRADIIRESRLTEATVDNALKALKERNIILYSETKKGEYRLPTKSFAVWIKALEQKPPTL